MKARLSGKERAGLFHSKQHYPMKQNNRSTGQPPEESMVEQSTRYGMRTTMELPFELALDRTRKALAREGFGIISEIDMATALKQKLDVTFRPYVILGACNPQLAHRALMLEHELGLLLPCNVVVYADDEQGNSVVAALDPVEALGLSDNEELRPVAEEVRTRIERVLKEVSEV
jgi:uncharacterized protein (DUF302 family)